MSLLLDTHILIWLATEPDRITVAERRLIDEARPHCWISAVSLWEIRIKWDSLDREGRRKGTLDPTSAAHFAAQNELAVRPLTEDVAIAPVPPPVDTLDPFDRILLVHAQQLGARLLTRDRKLLGHPLVVDL